MGKVSLLAALSTCALLTASPGSAAAQDDALSDIDAFMQKVLEQRNINWELGQNYVFSEREGLDLTGLNVPALESFQREYVWFYRDGKLIRSLVKANGVRVSEEEQRRFERKSDRKEKGKNEEELTRESFFKFKFEPGNYFFVGREQFEGREVVVVEYYPDEFFDGDNDTNGTTDPDDEEEKIEEAFKKTTLVTMWIVPEIHQLAKITFENVGLEFLPYRWLVRVDDIRASMVLDTPIEGVWLPREISASGSVSTALNSLTVAFSRRFFDYQEADVKVRLEFEKPPPRRPPPDGAVLPAGSH